MKNAGPVLVFMLIGILGAKTLHAQSFYKSHTSPFITKVCSFVPPHADALEHQPDLYLHMYRRERGHRLQNTGVCMLFSGIFCLTTGIILSNELEKHRPNARQPNITPAKNENAKILYGAGGLITGPPLIISGTIVLISGSLKLRH